MCIYAHIWAHVLVKISMLWLNTSMTTSIGCMHIVSK